MSTDGASLAPESEVAPPPHGVRCWQPCPAVWFTRRASCLGLSRAVHVTPLSVAIDVYLVSQGWGETGALQGTDVPQHSLMQFQCQVVTPQPGPATTTPKK